jgi:hypothetical protein
MLHMQQQPIFQHGYAGPEGCYPRSTKGRPRSTRGRTVAHASINKVYTSLTARLRRPGGLLPVPLAQLGLGYRTGCYPWYQSMGPILGLPKVYQSFRPSGRQQPRFLSALLGGRSRPCWALASCYEVTTNLSLASVGKDKPVLTERVGSNQWDLREQAIESFHLSENNPLCKRGQ